MFCFIDRRRRRGIILSIVIGRSIHHIGNHGERYERVTWQPIVQLLIFAPVRVVVCIGCWLLPPSFWYASRAAMSDRRTKKTGITVKLAKSFHGFGILTFIYLSASRAPWFG
jgi:hypothetical protein